MLTGSNNPYRPTNLREVFFRARIRCEYKKPSARTGSRFGLTEDVAGRPQSAVGRSADGRRARNGRLARSAVRAARGKEGQKAEKFGKFDLVRRLDGHPVSSFDSRSGTRNVKVTKRSLPNTFLPTEYRIGYSHNDKKPNALKSTVNRKLVFTDNYRITAAPDTARDSTGQAALPEVRTPTI